jgi:hypothetical protein
LSTSTRLTIDGTSTRLTIDGTDNKTRLTLQRFPNLAKSKS